MRIPSGKIDQLIFFVAIDSIDRTTRKTGLTTFTVYRSRNGGTATVYTTPTITELDSTNMPGVYSLTVDEDTTVAATSDSEEYCVHITQANMAPVTRTIELYRRDTTSGNTALVDSNGRVDLIKVAGTTQTARDIGASVLLSAGTGTGQLDFTAGVVKANATQILGTAISTPATAGILDVNLKNIANATVDTTAAQIGVNAVNWRGGAIPAVNVTGVPLIDLKYTLGTISPAAAGSVRADAVTGAVGSVTGAVGSIASGGIAAASFAVGAINAAAIADAAIDRATFASDTGLLTARSNTAQAGAAGTITLDVSASATTDFYVGMWIVLTGGTGIGQARVCTAYNGSTKVATVAPNWATNPDVTSTFAVNNAANVSGVQGNLTGSVGSVTGAVGSVTGNVGGNVVGSVASVTAGVTVTTNNDKTGYSLAADQAVNATKWAGGTIPAPNVTGVPLVDAKYLLGTVFQTPTVAGIPNVNVKTWNDLTTVALPLIPTTAGRTLDVSATGEAGLDWANIGGPTTAVNLSATFIQGVNSLASGTDSVSTIATSGSTLTTGSASSGTYASTKELDGTYWQIADTTGTLDMYFEFNVGTLGVPTSAFWNGGLTTAVNSLKVYAYNWGGSAWEQVGTVNGLTSLIVAEQEFNFTTSHVGTGGNVGLVRLRFQNTGLVAANFYTDRVLCSYTNIYSFPSNFASLVIDGSGRVDVSKVGGTSQTAADLAARLGAPAGASLAADIAEVEAETDDIAAIKTQTDKLTFTVTNQVDVNVIDWKGVTAPAMTGDAYARLGAPAGASIAADLAEIELETDDIAAIKSKTDNLPATPAAVSDIPTAAAISDEVWDELVADHLTGGSTGASLNAAGSAGDPWATALPGSYGAGTAGKLVGTNLDATVSSRTKPADTQAAVTLVTTTTSVTNDVGITQAGADKAWTSATRTLTSFGTLVADTASAVWAAATRLLTAGTNIVLAKGVGVTGFNDLDGSGVRTAVGMASANLDSQLAEIEAETDDIASIKAKTDNLPSSPAAVSDIPTAAANATAVGSTVVEGTTTIIQMLRGYAAAMLGKASGLATTTAKYRDTGDTKDRITATVDSDGNRSSVNLDLS